MIATTVLRGLLWLSVLAVVSPSRAYAQTPPTPAETGATVSSQAQSQHGSHTQEKPKPPASSSTLPPDIPQITDADRRAAFPEGLHGHAVHDDGMHYYVLFDQLEWQSGPNRFSLDNKGWVGGDRDRMWFRVEGVTDRGRVDEAHAHVLYGRAISRWWDLVAGVRQDLRPGPSQTWAAIGVQGLAPYWFEIEATAYVGESAQTHFRLEAEYELLFTNRLVLQPLVELELYGKSIPERAIGAGLSSAETGMRLRYEIRREFAPYVGVTWRRKFGGTADFARAEGENVGGARVALGLRLWF